MADSMSLPFLRGTTYFNGGTVDATSGDHLEGQEYVIKDDAATGRGNGTGMPVTLRVVRWTGTFGNCLPKRVVKYSTTAGEWGKKVTGYANASAEDYAGVADDQLPAAGVPLNDLFYIVVKGPTKVCRDFGTGTSFTVGARVVAMTTAASSGGTTAGRIVNQVLTGATDVLAGQVQNAVGVCLSAVTTSATTTDPLIWVGYKR